MNGKDLKLSGTQADIDPTTGEPIVTMQFTGKGNKLFHEVTRNEAQRGQIQQTPQSFAIVLDNQIYSFPTIDYNQYGDGIDPTGTGAQITGLAVAEGGAEPRARPPDRRAARQLRHGRAHRRLGDARQGLAPPGAQRRDRRPDRRRDLPAARSTASSASSR